MSARPVSSGLTLEEYLKVEERLEGRAELVGGEIRTMAGGTERHDLLANAVNVQLVLALRGGPCRVFPHNRRLVNADGNSYYPDVLVNCGPAADPRYEDDATLLVEVLSPSNTRDELDDKLEHYTRLRSLQTYLTLDPDSGAVTVYERHDLGWRSRMATRHGTFTVDGGTLDLRAAYDEVDAQATT